ncbi:MAG: hypothetical protein ACREM3_25170 [Candidatus Rokuibacteriota bacterium]
MRNFDQRQRREVLGKCVDILAVPSLRRVERFRVGAVKVLVALLPSSLQTIHQWLHRRGRDDVYEVHFTLFCFLDRVVEVSESKALRRRVLSELRWYLGSIKSEAAQAAWMAGDLLGDHWNVDEALPVLVWAANHAQHDAGRRGAVHGIAHMMNRVSGAKHRALTELLDKVARSDPSGRMRHYANKLCPVR